jgi:hypothetical protein
VQQNPSTASAPTGTTNKAANANSAPAANTPASNKGTSSGVGSQSKPQVASTTNPSNSKATSSSGRSVAGGAQSSAKLAPSQGGGGFSGGFGRGGFSGGFGHGRPSDIRLKQDIVPLGRLADGIGIYRFRYKGDDHTLYVGVMAQEVQNVVPGAVSRDRDGFLRVDYDRLDIAFMTWSDYVARDPAWPLVKQ